MKLKIHITLIILFTLLSPIASYAQIVDIISKEKLTYVKPSGQTAATYYYEWTSPETGINYYYNSATEDKSDYMILSLNMPIISNIKDDNASQNLIVKKIVFNINNTSTLTDESAILILTPETPFQSKDEVITAANNNEINQSVKVTDASFNTPIEINIEGEHKFLGIKSKTGRIYINSIAIYYEPQNTVPVLTVSGTSVETGNNNQLTISSAGAILRPSTTFYRFDENQTVTEALADATPDKETFSLLTEEGLKISKPGTLHLFTRDANGNDSEITSYSVNISDLKAQSFIITNKENFTDKAYTALSFPESLVEGTEVSLYVNNFDPVKIQGTSIDPAEIINDTYGKSESNPDGKADPYPSASLITVQSELSLNDETAKSVPQYYVSTPKLKIESSDGSATYKATIRHGNTSVRYIISDNEPSQFDPETEYAIAGQSYDDLPVDIAKNQYITIWAYTEYDGSTLISPVATYTLDDSFLVSVNTLTDDIQTEQWFTLDGLPVKNRPSTPGLYIRRTSQTSSTILIRH